MPDNPSSKSPITTKVASKGTTARIVVNPTLPKAVAAGPKVVPKAAVAPTPVPAAQATPAVVAKPAAGAKPEKVAASEAFEPTGGSDWVTTALLGVNAALSCATALLFISNLCGWI